MNNGFYFKNSDILSEYYLLQKLNLIQSEQIQLSETINTEDYLYLNGRKHSFCSFFNYNSTADYIIIFSPVSTDILQKISIEIKNHQMILFVAHILFDYQTVFQEISDIFDFSKIIILTDDEKNPYIITNDDARRLSLKHQVISFKNTAKKKELKQNYFNPKAAIQLFLYNLLKLFLKPGQFFKDLYSTYNFSFFYGKFRTFFIKLFFLFRNFLFKITMSIFYFLRHISIMSFVHIYYSLKIFLIRLYYWAFSIIKFGFIFAYYKSTHLIKILIIQIQGVLHRSWGFLIWCYYRMIWSLHRIHEFNMNYTFYPFRKIYWFSHYQFNKRILKKLND